MAWLTRENARSYSRAPKEPDMETLAYWLTRLEPLIRAETEGEIIVVLANRCGMEEEVVYAGTSAVLGIQGGEVKVYGILGRGERELLVVDTNKRPQAKLISQPTPSVSHLRTKSSNRDSDISNPRTDSTYSTFSENSGQSSSTNVTNLSVTTSQTSGASASPATPDAMDIDLSMDEIITPISPVDAQRTNAFYAPKGRKPEPDTLQEALKSSIGHPQTSPAQPDSPTFARPPSPKSRNASRTRQPEYQEPALTSHDLAQEPQLIVRSFGVKSPPHSASAVPDQYQAKLTSRDFGPRSQYIVPRPKSMVW
jgi:protein N-terminal amidase